MKYAVTGKLINCQETVGYEVTADNGKVANISKDKFNSLMEKGLVENCVQCDGNYILLASVYTKLPVKNKKYILKDKIYSGESTIGYEISDESGKISKVSLARAWELALDKGLDGVESYVVSQYGTNRRVVLVDEKKIY